MQIGEAVAAGGPGSAPRQPTASTSRWIEVKLVDVQGHPVADARYEIETPDGAVHRGRLDASGMVRLSGLGASGACKVRWPDLDPWVGSGAAP